MPAQSYAYQRFLKVNIVVAKWRVELLYLAHRLGASVIHLPSSFFSDLGQSVALRIPLPSYLLHLHSTAITGSVLGYLGAVLA